MRMRGTLEFFGCLLLAICLVGLFVYSLSIPLLVTEDGQDYLGYADILRSGAWSQLNEFNRVSLRSPLYPIMISALMGIFGPSFEAVRILHAIIGIATIALVSRALAQWINPIITAFLVLFTFTQVSVFFLTVLTEWSASCLLMILFASLVRYFHHPSPSTILAISLICSLGICLRAALSPIACVPFAAIIISQKKGGLLNWASAVFGLLPIALLIVVNWAVFEFAGISPLGGINLFGMSTLVTDELPAPSQSDDLMAFTDKFKFVRHSKFEHTMNVQEHIKDEVIANYNMWHAGVSIAKELGWSYTKYGRVGLEYASAIILTHSIAYLSLVFQQWLKLFSYLYLSDWILLLCGVGVILIKDRRLVPVVIATVVLIAVHLAHAFFCALSHPSIYRHMAISMSACQLSLIALIGSAIGILRRADKL